MCSLIFAIVGAFTLGSIAYAAGPIWFLLYIIMLVCALCD